MNFRLYKDLTGLFFLIILIGEVCPSNSHVKNSKVSHFTKQDSLSYQPNNPEYERLLDKADWAFKIGMLKRAKKLYTQAAVLNPKSIYIRYRLREIQKRSNNFNNFLLYFNFDKPDLLIRSLTYCILFFISSMLVVLLFILFNRNRMDAVELRKQKQREKYQGLLVDYLFATDNIDIIPSELKKISSSSFNRTIVIDQMIDLSINLMGTAKEKLRYLFLALNLDKDSIRKAYSRKWHIKIKGFRELAF